MVDNFFFFFLNIFSGLSCLLFQCVDFNVGMLVFAWQARFWLDDSDTFCAAIVGNDSDKFYKQPKVTAILVK